MGSFGRPPKSYEKDGNNGSYVQRIQKRHASLNEGSHPSTAKEKPKQPNFNSR